MTVKRFVGIIVLIVAVSITGCGVSAAQDPSHSDLTDGNFKSLSESSDYWTSESSSVEEPLRERIGTFQGPIFRRHVWLHDGLSWSHAVMCSFRYLILTWRMYISKTAIGISMQSLCALTFSELAGFSISVFWCVKYGMLPGWAFYFVDMPSTVLAVACLFTCIYMFSNTMEVQYDTFGLNIANRLLVFSGSANIDTNETNANVRAGMLKPKGAIGTFLRSTYWIFLYLLAVPLTIMFTFIRRNHVDWLNLLLCYDDSVRALALIPQLYMFHIKQARRVSEQLAIFVMCEFFLRIIALVYWLSYPLFRVGESESGSYSAIVQIVNLLFVGDFAYHYFCAKLRGEQGVKYQSEIFLPLNACV